MGQQAWAHSTWCKRHSENNWRSIEISYCSAHPQTKFPSEFSLQMIYGVVGIVVWHVCARLCEPSRNESGIFGNIESGCSVVYQWWWWWPCQVFILVYWYCQCYCYSYSCNGNGKYPAEHARCAWVALCLWKLNLWTVLESTVRQVCHLSYRLWHIWKYQQKKRNILIHAEIMEIFVLCKWGRL